MKKVCHRLNSYIFKFSRSALFCYVEVLFNPIHILIMISSIFEEGSFAEVPLWHRIFILYLKFIITNLVIQAWIISWLWKTVALILFFNSVQNVLMVPHIKKTVNKICFQEIDSYKLRFIFIYSRVWLWRCRWRLSNMNKSDNLAVNVIDLFQWRKRSLCLQN